MAKFSGGSFASLNRLWRVDTMKTRVDRHWALCFSFLKTFASSPTSKGWRKFGRIFHLVKMDGKFPADRLMTFYPLAEITHAAENATTGKTIKPVLLMPNPS